MIPLSLIEDHPKEVKAVFWQLDGIVVRAECLYHNKCIEYVLVSEKFQPVEMGDEVPTYIIEVDGSGVFYKVKAIRQC